MSAFWDSKLAIYRDEDGKEIPYDKIRDYVDAVSNGVITQLRGLTDQQINNSLSVPEWATAAIDIIKPALVSSAIIAIGGKAQLTPKTSGRIGKEVGFHLTKFRAFANDVENDTLTDLEKLARAALYGGAVVAVFELITQGVKISAGFTEAKNILHEGVIHCKECPAITKLGWLPIKQMKPVGRRICLVNDRCRVIYR